jgi:hypothetical protein
MKTISTRRAKLGSVAISLALAAIIGGIAVQPARADDDDRGRGHEESRRDDHYRGHDRDHDWQRRHRDVYVSPGYDYAPPPVVYAPIPVAPSLNFFIPLRFH